MLRCLEYITWIAWYEDSPVTIRLRDGTADAQRNLIIVTQDHNLLVRQFEREYVMHHYQFWLQLQLHFCFGEIIELQPIGNVWLCYYVGVIPTLVVRPLSGLRWLLARYWRMLKRIVRDMVTATSTVYHVSCTYLRSRVSLIAIGLLPTNVLLCAVERCEGEALTRIGDTTC